jgi:mannose-6-phosphate isomerase-like protein (cupin superfamily)
MKTPKRKPIRFHGLKIYDYTAGTKSASSFAIIKVPPGKSHPRAFSRRSEKFYCVIKGAIVFCINGKIRKLKSGDSLLVPKGKEFSYRNASQKTGVLALVHTPAFRMKDEVFLD